MRPRQRRPRQLRRPREVTPARWVAWVVVSRTFDDDAWTDRALEAALIDAGIADDRRERAFAQLLAYGTVQQAKRLDYLIGVLGKRPLRKLDPPVLHALRIGLYELLELSTRDRSDAKVTADDPFAAVGASSAHAAVHQAVELVRGVLGERAVAFTNAILRRAQVDAADVLGMLDLSDESDLAIDLSMPQWLVALVRAAHGDRGIAALRAQNDARTSTAFRRNIAHSSSPDLVIDASWRDGPLPGSLLVPGSTAGALAAVQAGTLVPQSLASQLVTVALDPRPGERVLDMCAAPGGKTTHIASLLAGSGEVVAVELHEHRAESIKQLAERTGTSSIVTVRCGDATSLSVEDVGTFDRVLVDAPCSGTGVLAARPDARWKRSVDGLAALVQLQQDLLEAAARLVRPGGVVVYSTCSILREEDEAQADAAAAYLDPDPLPEIVGAASELDATGTRARTWPGEHGSDGFFVARFRRSVTGARGELAP